MEILTWTRGRSSSAGVTCQAPRASIYFIKGDTQRVCLAWVDFLCSGSLVKFPTGALPRQVSSQRLSFTSRNRRPVLWWLCPSGQTPASSPSSERTACTAPGLWWGRALYSRTYLLGPSSQEGARGAVMDLVLYITTTWIHAETNKLKFVFLKLTWIYFYFLNYMVFREILYTFYIRSFLKLGNHRKCLNLKWPSKWHLFCGRKRYRVSVVSGQGHMGPQGGQGVLPGGDDDCLVYAFLCCSLYTWINILLWNILSFIWVAFIAKIIFLAMAKACWGQGSGAGQ